MRFQHVLQTRTTSVIEWEQNCLIYLFIYFLPNPFWSLIWSPWPLLGSAFKIGRGVQNTLIRGVSNLQGIFIIEVNPMNRYLDYYHSPPPLNFLPPPPTSTTRTSASVHSVSIFAPSGSCRDVTTINCHFYLWYSPQVPHHNFDHFISSQAFNLTTFSLIHIFPIPCSLVGPLSYHTAFPNQ